MKNCGETGIIEGNGGMYDGIKKITGYTMACGIH